jgi:hexosaminidase
VPGTAPAIRLIHLSNFVKHLIFVFLWIISPATNAEIIPLPVDDRALPGEFVFPAAPYLSAPADDIGIYIDLLAEAGVVATPAAVNSSASIQFLSERLLPDRYSPPVGEAYVLRITPEGINIHAASPAGHFYGLQSLVQLVEAAHSEGEAVRLACRSIVDVPRFAWRGFMLDESRHFTGVAGVKRLLDAMARFKLNRFHWHLTDSAAWRIEIKKYPELTRVGGRGSESDRRPDAPVEFYSQDQIREIVAYAKQRAITIIPEIDMPGHADAAVLAYPEHDGGGYESKDDPQKWPRFTFNPAKQETLEFLDDILREVAGLFPDAEVIHFGGDEVHFGWHHWPRLPEVQKLMKTENLADLAAVETWFSRRMAATINGLGFKTGGWDEVVARDLPADKTLIWWWRHDKPEILAQALADGYPLILCPRLPCYLDFVQHESHVAGRRWNGFNPLSATYQFPSGLNLSSSDESKVLGIQACLWTEATVTQARRDFMTWPRLIALAEAAWTAESKKDFGSFEKRLEPQFRWLDSRGITYYNPFSNSGEITDHAALETYLDKPE